MRARLLAIASIMTSQSAMLSDSQLLAAENDPCMLGRQYPVLRDVVKRTYLASSFVRPSQDICKAMHDLKSTPANQIFLTTSRVKSKFLVCATILKGAECDLHIATIRPGLNPSATLSFVYADKLIDSNGPQNQTVERLFIRPSKNIR